jgi:phytoene synthase
MSDEMRLLARAGKTFYFATLWLDKSVRQDAALAYTFCRTVDDIADGDLEEGTRDTYLRDIARAVVDGDMGHELIRPLEPLLTRYPEVTEPLSALVHACRQDTPVLTINDEQDLEKYAFGVAGNVGLIMYPILGGTLPAGREYAAQLGMAMQGTNIARDVVEDLERGRVYIPSMWLDRCDLRQLLADDGRYERTAVRAVENLLRWAGERYSRGLSGLQYLAPGNRFAIQVAARCYAAIGDRVIVRGRLARRRATVSLGKKIVLACQTRLCKERVSEYHT